MIPTWLVVEKVVHEMDSVRRGGRRVRGGDGVEQALQDADRSVRSLSLASDTESVHQAWRAVARAEQAVESALRMASPRKRHR